MTWVFRSKKSGFYWRRTGGWTLSREDKGVLKCSTIVEARERRKKLPRDARIIRVLSPTELRGKHSYGVFEEIVASWLGAGGKLPTGFASFGRKYIQGSAPR